MLHIWLHDKSLADISAQQDLLAAQLASLAGAAEGSVQADLRSRLDFYAQFLVALAYWKEIGCVGWDPDPTLIATVATHAPNTTTLTVDSAFKVKTSCRNPGYAPLQPKIGKLIRH
ncbi:hypothetical protein CXG81DRAFT_25790 [Caulochytrium protostelioides]|uniref:Uncharacterized protein n=1 Tax=Caulochytrium protostelioides TaxID=1555241 RepID=A0A4P9X8D4_9FUNG|nr:hypothetical protein CXG81DRAFT_25790 [Caulochytrium protostelioides]|eukprot:RKP01515.1 hypothetical protein CXG81DRAFT_25790 [Caulochytrium protostelioides]